VLLLLLLLLLWQQRWLDVHAATPNAAAACDGFTAQFIPPYS
jgi:hypothetical protein